MNKDIQKELQYLENLIEDEFKIVLKENTRKQRYVYARLIFITIANDLIIKDEHVIAEFLKKDRTTIIYNLCLDVKDKLPKDYLIKYDYIRNTYLTGEKNNSFEDLTVKNLLKRVKTLEEHNRDLEKTLIKEKNKLINIKNISKYEAINELLSLEHSEILDCIKYKIEPHLKMLKTKVTNKDLVDFQKQTRKM